MLLQALVNKSNQFEGINYESVFSKSLQDYTFMIKEYKFLFNKVIDYYAMFPAKFMTLDAYTVVELAKFLTTQDEVTIKAV